MNVLMIQTESLTNCEISQPKGKEIFGGFRKQEKW